MQKYLPTTGICPRQFCREWFGIAKLSPDEMAEHETQSGYRKQCVRVLVKTLGVKERTVRGWGKGLSFEKCPEPHRLALAYALQAAKAEQKKYSQVA